MKVIRPTVNRAPGTSGLPLQLRALRQRQWRRKGELSERCPFNVGDIVYYRPSSGCYRLLLTLTGILHVGQPLKIAKIIGGEFVTLEGFDHPSGGIYWTEFSAT